MSDLEIPEFKFAIREDLNDTKDLFVPHRATARSAGWDVKAAMKDRAPLEMNFGDCAKIPLGFRAFCPDGWWYELKPRSSTFGKKNLHALYGTIDEDFEGELVFACQYLPDIDFQQGLEGLYCRQFKSLKIEFGEAIGQIIPVRRQDMIVTRVSNSEIEDLYKQRGAERGAGGFGSTSK
jgi:dUTP pyrophosphatase